MNASEEDGWVEIPAILHIRRNADGVVRTMPETFNNYYLWSDGNYSCDCNRALFFARAVDEAEPDEPPCGETAYCVQLTAADDGRLLYEDEAWKGH